MKKHLWEYDENKHVGMDYSEPKIAQNYEKEHSEFRDFDEEVRAVVNSLGLNEKSTILDIGCGNGSYAVRLAGYCNHVYAVDISESMLEICKEKAEKKGIQNISIIQGGFLTYEHNENKVDAIISTIALHHLPDFWKLIALKRLYNFLKDSGKLFLVDLVFCFDPDKYRESLNEWLKEMETKAGADIMQESIIHIKEEFSTWDWIMRGLLEKAGFKIDNEEKVMDNVVSYICSKKK